MRSFVIVLVVGIFLFTASPLFAACPVGKKDGDTWCKNGREWKCYKCGTEFCEIMTGNSCLKDDFRDDSSALPNNSELQGTACVYGYGVTTSGS